MQIAGYNFRPVMGPLLCNSPGIFIYTHQATGKNFVRSMRNCGAQRGKNNYPNYLKELLRTNPSEVLLFMADLPKDTKEVLYLASRAVVSYLSEQGTLYKRPKPNRGGMYRQLNGEEQTRFTVWLMTHKKTGALFYFEERKGVSVEAKASQRLLTFNNYVMRRAVNANRVMYMFAKEHFPLDIEQWVLRDLDLEYESEQLAIRHITKLSKTHLEAGELVLSKVASNDPLYYRNTMLKLEHIGLDEYLQPKAKS